jgi:Lrp/AsnC family transcriptional regulator for asnA, asnC and gidA
LIKKLDKKNIELLKLLQKDGRASYTALAKEIGISETAIYMRMKKLMNEGYIKKFQAILDSNKLGLNLIAFIGIKASPSKYDDVLKELVKMPEICELYDITGEYYCLAKVRSINQEELAKILDKIGHIDGVISSDTKIVLRTIKENFELPIEILFKQS